jgi:hypothetical protein
MRGCDNPLRALVRTNDAPAQLRLCRSNGCKGTRNHGCCLRFLPTNACTPVCASRARQDQLCIAAEVITSLPLRVSTQQDSSASSRLWGTPSPFSNLNICRVQNKAGRNEKFRPARFAAVGIEAWRSSGGARRYEGCCRRCWYRGRCIHLRRLTATLVAAAITGITADLVIGLFDDSPGEGPKAYSGVAQRALHLFDTLASQTPTAPIAISHADSAVQVQANRQI